MPSSRASPVAAGNRLSALSFAHPLDGHATVPAPAGSAGLAQGYKIPRSTQVRSLIAKGDQTACVYTTGHNVTLWPLKIVEAKYYTRELASLEIPRHPQRQRRQGRHPHPPPDHRRTSSSTSSPSTACPSTSTASRTCRPASMSRSSATPSAPSSSHHAARQMARGHRHRPDRPGLNYPGGHAGL